MPPFVYRERTRHGRFVYYLRRGKGSRTRLPEYGSEGFQEAYSAALTQGPIEPASNPCRLKARAGSFAWLIARYRESSYYLALSRATRKQRDNIFKHVVEASGHVSAKLVTRHSIEKGREKRAVTPAQSRNFLDAMRGLFKWAEKAEMVDADPTVGVTNPGRPKTGGFPAWNDDDVAAFETRWPAGTRQRVWLHVLLYTGLRRGDAVRIGRQHVRDGVAMIRTEKNGTEVNITILPPLAESLAIGPTGDLAFICGVGGQPLTKESFGNYFRSACTASGVRKSAHGVRKLSATRVAEAGATVAELEAMFGWNGGTMASLYTKSADRRRLAASGGRKIGSAYGSPQ